MTEVNLQKLLLDRFQLEAFRPGQEPIIRAIIQEQDTLAVMPTGGGKSLCFQLPALAMEGIALVISPLISLMQDQVDSLESRGISATLINSSGPPGEQRRRADAMQRGEYDLVYIAPERFRHQGFVESLRNTKIALLAIDEAHCLSQWGHDFRPDYLLLGKALERLNQRPVIAAFTATATPEVRDDIVLHLGLKEPQIFVSGFARKNLSLNVLPVSGKTDKLRALDSLIVQNRTGIVYCATRKRVEEVAEHLSEWKVPHVAYHAGMSDQERQRAQEDFMRRKVDVAVATNAFGMGIDRSDIRFVAHYEIPGSLEAYYQEVGRAGRDGGNSVCELYYNFADKRTQEFFIEGNNPSGRFIRDLYGVLQRMQNKQFEVTATLADITEEMGGSRFGMAVSSAISYLRRIHLIERFDIPGSRSRGTRLLQPHRVPSDLPIDDAALRDKMLRDESKLETIIRFANTPLCRQAFILKYFGEPAAPVCESCDRCAQSKNTSAKVQDLTEAQATIVRKALSGVARASTRRGRHDWEPLFGRGKITRMLAGSQAADITESGLHQTSTFGILKDQSPDFIKDLFVELERSGLVSPTTDPKFPKLKLNIYGSQIMLGEAPPPLCWPQRNGKAKTNEKSGPNHTTVELEDPELYERLRQQRMKLAKARDVPPFTIFNNATLVELANVKPTSIEAAIDISGIGPYKAKKYMPPFLEIIRATTA
ncbi:MAG: RecQ family ATP-dependent DNA helicase [Verrucomicrobiota bacterium]